MLARRLAWAAAIAAAALAPAAAQVDKSMTFFVISTGLGRGGDLGGLEGADKHCQTLATAAGAGRATWRAYLSVSASGGAPPVHARERIGPGPWRNAKGDVVAENVEHLHSPANNINKQTALTEKGETVRGRGDSPNMQDMLTGSAPDGRAFPAEGNDMTCRNWRHEGEGAAMVGHHDRVGLDESLPMKSWNSAHPTRGCSQDALRATGGAGLFYCFAAK